MSGILDTGKNTMYTFSNTTKNSVKIPFNTNMYNNRNPTKIDPIITTSINADFANKINAVIIINTSPFKPTSGFPNGGFYAYPVLNGNPYVTGPNGITFTWDAQILIPII